jgi:hypothetical protein
MYILYTYYGVGREGGGREAPLYPNTKITLYDIYPTTTKHTHGNNPSSEPSD